MNNEYYRKTLQHPATGVVCPGKLVFVMNNLLAQRTEILLFRLAALPLQESASDKHGCCLTTSIIRSLSFDRKEPLNRVFEVCGILLAITVFVAPGAVELVRCGCTNLIGFSRFQPCLYELSDAVRLFLVFLICQNYSVRVG